MFYGSQLLIALSYVSYREQRQLHKQLQEMEVELKKKVLQNNFVVVDCIMAWLIGEEQAFVNTEFISCSCVLRENML